MNKPRLRRWIVAGLLAVATLFGINAAILFMVQPATAGSGEPAAQYGDVSVMLVKELKAGNLGEQSPVVTGYVNVLSPEPVIYLNKDVHPEVPPQTSYIYRHELAHVLQKRLIAEQVGGYPSLTNPAVSFAYYYQLLRLNSHYASLMPKASHDAHSQTHFSGLEISADCFTQRTGQQEPLTYAGSSFCNDEQRHIALALLSERWPTPLSVEEQELTSQTIRYPWLSKEGRKQ